MNSKVVNTCDCFEAMHTVLRKNFVAVEQNTHIGKPVDILLKFILGKLHNARSHPRAVFRSKSIETTFCFMDNSTPRLLETANHEKAEI